ncbi:LysE family translocator [Photobacterium halotolerans]|uniref:LysE family translocator n=1 Tax=Photobacterium halotolerans TaxID=265726 RepID=UPI0023511232|nr:LysE family transporter [Photobacterium halotolerans]
MEVVTIRFSIGSLDLPDSQISTAKGNYLKGLLIHLTNPKAVLFFGALYSMGVPAAAGPADLISVILVVGLVSASVFLGYAALFSRSWIRQLYLRSKRGFESLFALFFGAASLKLLFSASGK